MSIHDMPEGMKSEFLAAFRAEFGFGEMTATANDDAAAMLKAAAWAWQASRAAVVVELPNTECFGEYSQEAASNMRDSCAEAIEEQGLNYKVLP
ncbi:hypothetical protein [Pseudomonas plecoglossicida]|uniref:hypothetical protein n=1 Tax=Pseudomonas plecoglossicida TaxID=70775 RepID=UPI000B05CCE2|nr:hypothetical protein [Pseudomonas plecoglossicida]